MKKIILTFVAITVMLFTTDAQTKKGTVLLGAGSQFSDTEWTQWSITPKIGYFIQDGLAIGAMVHFDTDDQYFPEYDGVAVPNSGLPCGVEIIGAHDEYTLTNSGSSLALFAKYYINNLFFETSLSSVVSQEEEWSEVTYWGITDIATDSMVIQTRKSTSNLGLGMGYAIFWGKFSIEPFIRFDIIIDGEQTMLSDLFISETTDVSGSQFLGGISVNVFF